VSTLEHNLKPGSRVLLIHPPVADTAEAEDLDMLTCVPPIGLLRVASHLRQRGCQVELLDCLAEARRVGRLRREARCAHRCGNWEEEGRRKPMHHFGLEPEELSRRLGVGPPADLVALGATFTWHLPGLREVVQACRSAWPATPVVVGGNAVSLCPEEAEGLEADGLVAGQLLDGAFLPTAIDLLPDRSTDFLQLVKGCPHRCSYCVTPRLHGGKVRARPPEEVFRELCAKQAAHATRCFVFYDDFILYRQERHLDPFLDLVAQERPGVVLEFALGFSAHLMTEALAARLRGAGVERVILALETTSEERGRRMHRPQHIAQFIRAVEILRAAGFRGPGLRAFYLIGLPDQTTREILQAILFLYHLGVTPSLTAYALTPGSEDMLRFGSRVADRGLEELAPGLWPFAHPGMRVRELDALYRYFHERFIPPERIAASRTEDPVVRQMQAILARRAHLPENW